MSSLTRVSGGTAISTPVDARKTIIANLTALELAFSDGRKLDQAQSDMRVALWQEAFDGLSPAVAVIVTRRMRLFNPRNPFAPTAQDLYEFAQATMRALRDAVGEWATSGRWRPGFSELRFKGPLPDGWFPSTLAAPFELGCLIDDDEAADLASAAVLKSVPFKLLRPTATRYDWDDLATRPEPPWQAIVERLPTRAITAEAKAIIAALDAEHAKHRAARVALDAELAANRRASALRDLEQFDADIARRADEGKFIPSLDWQERHKSQLRRAAGLEPDLYPDGDA